MTDEVKAPKTKTYTLKEGMKHSDRDGVYTGGDEVQLTETAYEAFKDKFEIPTKEKKAAAKEGLAPGEPASTPTAPKVDGDGKQTAVAAPKADATKPGDTATGAGAAANSSNVAK